MFPQTKLVIFDKDGVLIETELAKTESYFSAVLEINRDGILLSIEEGSDYYSEFESIVPIDGKAIEYPGLSKEQYANWHSRQLTGKSRGDAVRGILNQFPRLQGIINKKFDSYLKEISEIGGDPLKELYSDVFRYPYEQMLSALRMKYYLRKPIEDCCKPIAPMNQLFRLLLSQKTKVALITESEWNRTAAELKVCGIPRTSFEYIACKDQIVNRRGKKVRTGGKKCDMYRDILCLTNVNEEDCLAIEDTDKGREEALVAGITCFQVFIFTDK